MRERSVGTTSIGRGKNKKGKSPKGELKWKVGDLDFGEEHSIRKSLSHDFKKHALRYSDSHVTLFKKKISLTDPLLQREVRRRHILHGFDDQTN